MSAHSLKMGLSISLALVLLGSCGNARDSWNGLIVSADGVQAHVSGPYATVDQCRAATLDAMKSVPGGHASCSQNCTVHGDLISDCKSTIQIN